MLSKTRFFAVLALAGCLALATWPQFPAPPSPSADPWASLRFLIGAWASPASPQLKDGARGGSTFILELGDKILVRKNWAEYPPKPGEKEAARHEDLMVIYPAMDGAPFRADYFDNEGHVIRYALSFPAGKTAASFESEATDKGPRFRLTYELGSDGRLSVDFAIATPGGTFKTYVQGVLVRAK